MTNNDYGHTPIHGGGSGADNRSFGEKLEDVLTLGGASAQKRAKQRETQEEEMIDKTYGKSMGDKFRNINKGKY